jgi:hypothetical protein
MYIFPVSVSSTEKNLATLLWSPWPASGFVTPDLEGELVLGVDGEEEAVLVQFAGGLLRRLFGVEPELLGPIDDELQQRQKFLVKLPI